MDFNVAIDEALKNVNQLERLGKRLTDEQPFIEAFPASVTYTVNLDTNFEDREAFVTGFSKYLEEATVQSDLVSILITYNQGKFMNLKITASFLLFVIDELLS